MYCPKCRVEYIDGVTQCADCEMPLVKELPEEIQEDLTYVDLETVFTTNDHGEIALAKAILDGEHLQYLVQGEIMTQVGAQPVRFMVPKNHLRRVKKLLKDFI